MINANLAYLNHSRRRRWLLITSVAALLMTLSLAPVLAQDRAQDNMLGGPDVPDDAVRTLVNLDAAGRLVRLEGRPEEAALDRLSLDEQRRQQSLAALRQHRLSLSLFLVDRLELLQQLAEALKTRDSAANRAIVRQLYDEYDPDHERDPLLDDLQPLLSPQEQQEMVDSLDEYWNAWIDSELANAKDRGDEARTRTQDRLEFTLFEQEVRRAYDGSIRPYREKLDLINAAIEPTDEQREAIRTKVNDFMRETRLEPTPEQRLDALKQIYLMLDEDRRTRLFELIASLQYGR